MQLTFTHHPSVRPVPSHQDTSGPPSYDTHPNSVAAGVAGPPVDLSSQTGFISGHLGITPSSVLGTVQVQISPSFALAHSNIDGNVVVEVRLSGKVRTLAGTVYSSFQPITLTLSLVLNHRKTGKSTSSTLRLQGLTTKSQTLLNEAVVLPEALDIGLRTDADSRLSALTPGKYEVPFRFSLPSVLPPSFDGWGGQVKYSLTASVRFKERLGRFQTTFIRRISKPINLRRYNLEHIMHPSAIDQIPSTSIVEPSTQSSSSAASSSTQKFNFEPNVPTPLPSTSTLPTLPPQLPLSRVNSIESGFTNGTTLFDEESFLEPVTFTSPTTSTAPIAYKIDIPSRSFGPGDPIRVGVCVSKVQDGVVVERIEVKLVAEVTVRTGWQGDACVRKVVGKWNRDGGGFVGGGGGGGEQVLEFVIPGFEERGSQASMVATGMDNHVGEGRVLNGEGWENIQVDDATPPSFEDLSNELLVSRVGRLASNARLAGDFVQESRRDQRTALLNALRNREYRDMSTQSQITDSGIAVGQGCLFQPWDFPKDTISSLKDKFMKAIHITDEPPKTNESELPLNSFSSPFISVRHYLQLQIICNKPIPRVPYAKQLLYLPNFQSEMASVSTAAGLPPNMDWKPLVEKMKPVGFSFVGGQVETGVVLHSASRKDREFLHGYLFGPAS